MAWVRKKRSRKGTVMNQLVESVRDGSKVRQRVLFHLGRYRTTAAFLKAWSDRAERHRVEATRFERQTLSLGAAYEREFGRAPSALIYVGPGRLRTTRGTEVVGAEAGEWSWWSVNAQRAREHRAAVEDAERRVARLRAVLVRRAARAPSGAGRNR